MSEEQCTPIDSVRTCLSRGQSIGAALNAEAGLISLTSLFILFILIIRNVHRNFKRPPNEQRSLVQEPTDVLMVSLFAADVLQGTGAAMSARWASLGHVETGMFCTAQGSIQQLGETAVAMTTLSIALQTFIAVCFRKFVHNRKLAFAVVACIWLFVVLFVGIGAGINGGTEYYAPTPYWCWIDSSFQKERILGEYLWFWLALFVSILVYVPLFLWGNGYLSVNREHWWKINFHSRPCALSEDEDSRERPPSLSLAILGYPVIYSILILPLSICRWIAFSQPDAHVPSAATFSVIFIFGLSGAANVILLLVTRPNLLLFDSEPQTCTDSGHPEDVERGTCSTSTHGQVRGPGRGRAVRRRRIHEKGRMVTPSRSSSRGSRASEAEREFADEFELDSSGTSAGLYNDVRVEKVLRDSESTSQPWSTP